MTYESALQWIFSLPRGKKMEGKKDMEALMGALHSPHEKLKFVHVAGTNGKGSTCAMIARALGQAGYRVGLNISPFILSFNERIQIGGAHISNGDLANLVDQVKTVVEGFQKKGVTFVQFEIVTALALLYFHQQACDIVCLEVGIGGLLDSTNIIKDSEVSVITSISIDHTDLLGDSEEDIAFQKGGIFKPNGRVVLAGGISPKAKQVLVDLCRQKNAIYIEGNMEQVKTITQTATGSKFSYKGRAYTLQLVGKHQIANALCAIEACNILQKRGFAITQKHIAAGLGAATFPARIERVSERPTVLVDGGHNIEGVRALCQFVDENFHCKKIAVVAMKKGKEIEPCLQRLGESFDQLYFSQFLHPVSEEKEKLLQWAKAGGLTKAACLAHPKEVLEKGEVDKNSLIVFCGSLYFASEVRNLLQDDKNV